MYNIRLSGIVTVNPPPYNEYILIKIYLKKLNKTLTRMVNHKWCNVDFKSVESFLDSFDMFLFHTISLYTSPLSSLWSSFPLSLWRHQTELLCCSFSVFREVCIFWHVRMKHVKIQVSSHLPDCFLRVGSFALV
jgi:hypothetical protein